MRTCARVRAADYYTFSRAGVTRFVGKGESEFTSLEQWEREYRLFGQLHAIPFFAKYRKWKGFSVWRKSVRRDKSGSAGNALLNGLFVLNPVLRSALFKLRLLCIGVEEWLLFEYASDKTYTLEEFVELQVRCDAVARAERPLWVGMRERNREGGAGRALVAPVLRGCCWPRSGLGGWVWGGVGSKTRACSVSHSLFTPVLCVCRLSCACVCCPACAPGRTAVDPRRTSGPVSRSGCSRLPRTCGC